MMAHLMTVIPPIHKSMMTTGEAAFWVLIGLLVVLAVVATVFWIVGNRRIAQRRPQMKEVRRGELTVLPR